MIKKYLLASLCWVFGLSVLAEPATIQGQLADCPNTTSLIVNEPVGPGYINLFYADPSNEVPVRDGAFQYTLQNEVSGFVRFQSKCLPMLLTYVEPGAQLTLTSATTGVNPGGIRFEGTNAAANNLLANRQLLNNGGADQQRIVAILAAGATARQVQQALQDTLGKYLTLLQALRTRQEITARCHDDLRAETEQRLLFWVYSLLVEHFADPVKANLQLKMPDAEVRRLLALLTRQYDPALPRYQRSSLNNSAQRAVLVKLKALPGREPAERSWAQFAPLFQDVNRSFAAIDYAPAAQQAVLVGDYLLIALTFGIMDEQAFAKVFAEYVRRFPTSVYIPIIARGLAINGKVAPAAATNQNHSLGYFADAVQGMMFGAAPGLGEVKTLEDLVQRYFAGKPVFVDFWASWCAPCIAEFRYEPELHRFLTQHGIEILYISVDKASLQQKWQELVAKNGLRGYHYLASAVVQEALKERVPYIPRYMLFDKNGKLVEASASSPSSKEKLYQQLQTALQKP